MRKVSKTFFYIKKSINKSKQNEDGSFEPTFNWGLFSLILAPSITTFTLNFTYFSLSFFVSAFYGISAGLVTFMIIFSYFYYLVIKENKKAKEINYEKIKLQEKKINELQEKTKAQTEFIDKLKEEKGYGFAIRELYIAFSILNQYFYDKRNKKEIAKESAEKEIKDILRSFCNCLSKIYTEKVGSKCSVSIKLIDEDFEKNQYGSVVKNFERDKDSSNRDGDKNYSTYEHKIRNNTCFYEIADAYVNNEEVSLSYSNSSLATDVKYKTSSIACRIKHLSDKEKNKIIKSLKNPLERPKLWNNYISYKSEIVVPLLLANKPFENSLLGFLCIDSEVENAFNDDYDEALIKGVADGIYEIITDFNSLSLT